MSELFDTTVNNPGFYFAKFFNQFSEAESIQEWYTLLELLIEHLETTKISAIFVVGLILKYISMSELQCRLIEYERLVDIHDFWRHLSEQAVFQDILTEYFRLVDLETPRYTKTVKSPINFQKILKRYDTDPVEENQILFNPQIRLEYDIYKACSSIESDCSKIFVSDFLLFLGYDQEQLERFRKTYLLNFRRFQTTKAALESV